MDVSRIDAISPKQIDWRKLTAKEIIKYDNQGVEVPTQYLQWAIQFRNDVEAAANDETTYEMANSNTQTSAESAEIPVDSAEDENSEPEKTAAQSKREGLEDAGVSLRNQARIFTGDSKEAAKASIESAALMENITDQSNNEIQNLENYMNALMVKINEAQTELKAEVANVNSGDNNTSGIGKINKLQQQIERYGGEGQSNIADTELQLTGYSSIINDQSSVVLNGLDFGSETIGVGNDLLTSIKGFFLFNIMDYIVGKRAVKAGETAVGTSEIASEIQSQANSANTSNISTAVSYKSEVESQTGVAGISLKNNADNQTTMEEKDEAQKAGKSADDVAQNPSNEQTEKAASANLDKVLQAKIKRGEVLEG